MRVKGISLSILLTCTLAFSTGPTGEIVGTVTDPSGRVVPGAKVTVRSQETNAFREVQTSASGDYAVPLLPPGIYETTVEAQNFRRAVYSNLRVAVNQTIRVDAMLEIGPLTQEIVVNEAAAPVQTDTSALGRAVDRQRILDLPLNERNFLNFALLVPGSQLPAEGSQNSAQGFALSVNGAREQSNDYLLDGVDNNDSAINHYTALPSQEAIQEFQVQSSNSTAEFGRSGGAQINVVLKSGSNQVHGSVFEFFRNRHLDAKNFFDQPDCAPTSIPGTCGEIPRFDRNQFGGTFGGPLRRDKSFLFGSYEGLRHRQAITREATVPSEVERSAALAAVPPGQRNEAGQAVFNLLPRANAGPDLRTSHRLVAAPVLRRRVDQAVVKWNHNFRPTDLLAFDYALFDENRLNPYDPLLAFTQLPGYGSYWLNRGQNAGLAWTHVFSPQWINEARLGFNRLRAGIFQESFGTSKSRELGFPEVRTTAIDLGYPNVMIAGIDGMGEPLNTPQERHDNTFHYADNMVLNPSFQGGRHHLKFGAEIRRFQLNFFLNFLARGEFLFLGPFTGDPLQDLLRGLPTYALTLQGDTTTGLRTTAQNYFFQDDFRLHPRVTLNLGVRYEYNSPPVEIRDRLSNPDLSPRSATCVPQPGCQFIVANTQGLPRATYEPDRNNLAPRIGLAWSPLASNRFVVRSAYGIFFDATILNTNVGPRFSPPFAKVAVFLNPGTATIQNILTGPSISPPAAPTMISPDYRDAYLQHWNLDLQYEAAPRLVFDLAYVGSKGTGLIRRRNLNQPRPGGPPPFLQFGPVQVEESASSSIYHGLQFRVEHSLSHGLSLMAAYTWSKAIDDSSALFGTAVEPGLPQNSFHLRAERGLSSFHTGQRFVTSFIYQLPAGFIRGRLGDGWLSRLLGDWKLGGILSFQSGRPFTVNRAIDQSGTGSVALAATDRPDQISDPSRPGPVAGHPDLACSRNTTESGGAAAVVQDSASWFNRCAFVPAPGRFGNVGRNSLIGPDLKNVDFSLLKEIPIRGESDRLQFRIEFFNLFNHPNFHIPDRILDSPTFGRVRSAESSRQIQLAVKYYF